MREKTLREKQEEWEHTYLSPFASFSDNTKGRDRQEEPCGIRPVYQRDRDRLLHCKAFRRLTHKTQVFLAPEGDHYRTRLTHTLEVAQTARTIARALRLNEDLTEAISLGHDLGHTPFGHAGERALDKACGEGFSHAKQSLRVVGLLEKDGQGLNLTYEVRDGILCHQTRSHPSTLEGKIVQLADKIAYINHDIDDAIRGKIIAETEIPACYIHTLGKTVKERLNTLIQDIIWNSIGKDGIQMSREVKEAMFGLREYMFQHVYTNPLAKGQEEKAGKMVAALYQYYLENWEKLPEEYLWLINEKGESKERTACDYIAGMTDRYAIARFQELMIPRSWNVY